MKRFALIAALSLAAAPVFAEGDAAAGEEAFGKKCVTCHVIEDADGNVIAGRNVKTGPNLYGVIGGPAAEVEGFRYGKGITEASEAGLVWTQENFTAYLADTTAFIREISGDRRARSNMAFKVDDPQEAADIHAYLMSVAADPNAGS
jgi:cytochrome c